jgi:hypothetical protein
MASEVLPKLRRPTQDSVTETLNPGAGSKMRQGALHMVDGFGREDDGEVGCPIETG